MRAIVVSVVSCLLASTAFAQSASQRSAVEEMSQTFTSAFNQQDATKVSSLFTEDAVRITPAAVLKGREAIQKDMEKLFKAGAGRLTVNVETVKPIGDAVWFAASWSFKSGERTVRGFDSLTLVPSAGTYKIANQTIAVTPPPPAAR